MLLSLLPQDGLGEAELKHIRGFLKLLCVGAGEIKVGVFYLVSE